MHSRTQERVERWDSHPFGGGYDGLSDLVADEFSGAVTAGGTWLFMLNGRVIGVVDGTIEDFDDAAGTAHAAPDPALPLLCSMEERGGETRGKYYTNDTPLSEVDRTLRDGSFTGYVELSESVLSGDYYAVYYGGRRMAAAYIGNAERLLTGEEAFERAADEVGIYEVVDVAVEVTDVPESAAAGPGPTDPGPADPEPVDPEPTDPEPTDPGPTDAATGAGSEPSEVEGAEASTPGAGDPDPTPAESLDDRRSVEEPPDGPGTAGGTTATDERRAEPSSSGITDDAGAHAESDPASAGERTDAEPMPAAEPDDAEPMPAAEPDETDPGSTLGEAGQETEPNRTKADESIGVPPADDEPSADPSADDEPIAAPPPDGESDADREADVVFSDPVDGDDESGDELEARFQEEAQWRETTSIPSLDPDRSESSDSTGRTSDASWHGQSESPASPTDDASASRTSAEQRSARTSESATQGRGAAESDEIDEPLESDMLEREDKIDQLKQRVDDLEQRRESLRAERDEFAAERDQFAAERDRLDEERDDLRAENRELNATVERLRGRVADLEDELDRLRSAEPAPPAGTATDAGAQLTPQRALAETNLFVRYDSKSQPTLASASDGEGDRTDVATNLRLEHHTQFDGAAATVDGLPYEEFLTASMEYRFVEWLTRTLLFEIRDTGEASGLGALYDAIPKIDRVELHSTIEVDVEAADAPDRLSFDVAAFDKRGNPLVVANLNDSRESATERMLDDLENDASVLRVSSQKLAAAFGVTSSFFEPGALEVAEDATSGGLLSRESKRSYVKLSRKQGYHLCLVESRSGGFHMNVPEL